MLFFLRFIKPESCDKGLWNFPVDPMPLDYTLQIMSKTIVQRKSLEMDGRTLQVNKAQEEGKSPDKVYIQGSVWEAETMCLARP